MRPLASQHLAPHTTSGTTTLDGTTHKYRAPECDQPT
jgi:hypothetical protein